MQKSISAILLYFLLPSLTEAVSLDDLQIRTAQNELVSNCFPGAEFSFATQGFSHNQDVIYDVIVRESSSLMVRKFTSIRPTRTEAHRIFFPCPKVKSTVRAYIRPRAVYSMNPSSEILFSTGLIPSLYNIEFSEGMLRFDSNIKRGTITVNLEGLSPIQLSATHNGQYTVRVPSQFTSGEIHLSNKHGTSSRFPLNAAFSVALRPKDLPAGSYHIYDNVSQSIVPLTVMRSIPLEHGKLNKVALYQLDDEGVPIVYATAYYLSGYDLVISPATTAASVIFDTFDTGGLSLVDRQAVYRFILESPYLQPLVSHLKKRAPTADMPLFNDKRSKEIVAILRARYLPHISHAFMVDN